MAQETVMAGFERLAQLAAVEQFRGWMLTIARNRSINFLRHQAAGRRALDRRPVDQAGPERANDDLQEAIAELPWDLRLPLVMYYFDGRSVKSVAQSLEISPSGVYQKLRAAIQELREIMTQQGEL